MPKKTGAGGELQSYDEATGRYSELSEKAKSTTEADPNYKIAQIALEHVPKAIGFANKQRMNTKHHQNHANEMGFKNQRDYERAGVEFFNGSRGKLYYGVIEGKYYRYNEKTTEMAVVSEEGALLTYMLLSNKKFKKAIKQEGLYEG